ncbi:Uma2 family endonuclease [Nocardia alni]|uniref:Uma2 family endonuclease n=1 Tax=Nocardia alni TaxID=2815723 RepID=UPI001C2273A0|nr:Uma2 family endonuclease [Nocardia alni]
MATELPVDPYELWLRDELAGVLELPHDGTRVEVIGGEIVVAPGPEVVHNLIVSDIHDTFAGAKAIDPRFSWRCLQMQDLDLSEIHDGYIPDLCIIDRDVARLAGTAALRKLVPNQLALAVEVTSPSNAAEDREPAVRRARPSKWNGYARVGIRRYLIVDRDPKIAAATLYSLPDTQSGSYQASESWKFGETIELPEPFGISIRTDEWMPWG